jgi:hypothetical protein
LRLLTGLHQQWCSLPQLELLVPHVRLDAVSTGRPSVLESTAAAKPALARNGPVATDDLGWRERPDEVHWWRREVRLVSPVAVHGVH